MATQKRKEKTEAFDAAGPKHKEITETLNESVNATKRSKILQTSNESLVAETNESTYLSVADLSMVSSRNMMLPKSKLPIMTFIGTCRLLYGFPHVCFFATKHAISKISFFQKKKNAFRLFLIVFWWKCNAGGGGERGKEFRWLRWLCLLLL